VTSEEAIPGIQRRGWLTVAVVAGGLFLAVVSTTVVSVALPTIGADLHLGPTVLEWVVDAYVLVYASLLIAGGVIGDRRGRKGAFVAGVALFGLGSLVTGLSTSVALLLAGRLLQGLGPALLVPGSLAIIRATYQDPRRRAAAIGLWSMSSGLALAVGPVLGGVVVGALGWRWVFLLNVPLSAALLAAAALAVPRLPRARSRGRIDWPGAALTIFGMAALAFAVIQGQDAGWTSAPIVAAFAASAAALAAFAAWERRLPEPLVDVRLFRQPAFAAASLAALVVFFSFVGSIVYLSACFQQVRGHSPLVAGLDVCAIGVALALAAALSGRLVGRIGERGPLVAGLAIGGAATLALLRLGPETDLGAAWWGLALVGAGAGLCGTPASAIAMSAVEASRAGMASAVVNAMRQVGQVFGVAVLGALVYAQLPSARGGGRLDPAEAALSSPGCTGRCGSRA
jgi:EmrB/QacA subfamily drug resistance transporter